MHLFGPVQMAFELVSTERVCLLGLGAERGGPAQGNNTEYKSVTVANDATAEEFMDFYLDDPTRPKWVRSMFGRHRRGVQHEARRHGGRAHGVVQCALCCGALFALVAGPALPLLPSQICVLILRAARKRK